MSIVARNLGAIKARFGGRPIKERASESRVGKTDLVVLYERSHQIEPSKLCAHRTSAAEPLLLIARKEPSDWSESWKSKINGRILANEMKNDSELLEVERERERNSLGSHLNRGQFMSTESLH